MVGNDIIDIAQARLESNWQRKGWANKIFTSREQELISLSSTKELTAWLMWSMKEAAYKIYHRECKEMFFAPCKFSCHNISDIKDNLVKGSVCFKQNTYNTSSYISSAFIHTIAIIQNNFDDVSVYIEDEINATDKYLQKHKLFKDSHGIPYYKDQSGQVKNASKSHHGRFEAIVIAKI